MLLHQDAFAAGYQKDGYMLLGMAIKYAGLRGKEVPCDREESEQLCRRRENSVSQKDESIAS